MTLWTGTELAKKEDDCEGTVTKEVDVVVTRVISWLHRQARETVGVCPFSEWTPDREERR